MVKTESPTITICAVFPIAADFPLKIDRSSFPLQGRTAANVACLSDRLVVFPMRGGFYDNLRCRLAVAEVPEGLFYGSTRGSTCSRAARGSTPCLEALESRNLLSNASGVWSFASAPALHPMKVNVLTLNPGASLDPIFVAPYAQSANPGQLVGETGPLIMDAAGNPIWFRPVSSNNRPQVLDFRTQTLFGEAPC